MKRPAPLAPADTPDLSLDPVDWESFRATAHRALDLALGHLEGAADRPVWQPVPDHVTAALSSPMPKSPGDLDAAVTDFQSLIQPYATGNTHPRFFGWVHGSGLADGVVAEMLSASMNANLGGRDHGAIHVERQVIGWFRDLFRFPADASGLLVSGTSMATLIGLAVARHAKSGIDIRKSGVAAIPRPLVGYTSREAHGSVARAFEVLGLGRDALRSVPVRDDFTMDMKALARMIVEDRAAGREPFVVIATAGTVNSGAIDDLDAAAEIAANENIWLHVDGAFGALAILSPDLAPRLSGIERADSLAFDFHKWMHVPYDAGCILVRDRAAHLAAFGSRADYLAGADRGLAAGEPWFCEFGPELSRGFRALKVWFALRTHGAEAFGRKILDNCDQARFLADRVAAHPDLELLAPVPLNIVCFRYVDPRLAAADLDDLNGQIVIALQELGIAAPSTTRIAGKLAIRANFTNHRTRFDDVDILVDAILRIAAGLRDTMLRTRTIAGNTSHAAGDEARSHLDRLLACADIDPFAAGTQVSLGDCPDGPFTVGPGASVTLAMSSLVSLPAARVLLRHALECHLWKVGSIDDPAREIACVLAAARSAALYAALLPAQDRNAALDAIPGWLRDGYDRLASLDPWSSLSVLLDPDSDFLDRLLVLSGGNPASARMISANVALKARASHLFASLSANAQPVEQLLAGGDDPRIEVCSDTGANGYGAEPRPVLDELSFASSTAASPSPRSFEAAVQLRRRLIAAALEDELSEAIDDEAAAVMCELVDRLAGDAADTTDVVLQPSGTHTVYTALALAAAAGEAPLTSIVIAPDETGSGVPLAAGGRHFFSTRGGSSEDPVLDITATLRITKIEIRTTSGRLRSPATVDRVVEKAVAAAVAAGRRPVLFALDSSKLGAAAPTARCLARLAARYTEALDIVVDACQLRLSPASITAYLELGAMVQVTGSKFLGGSPFCGALLLPDCVAARAGRASFPRAVPTLALSQTDPRRWRRFERHLPDTACLPLLARWRTALAELSAFDATPRALRRKTMLRLAAATRRAIARHPELAPLDTPLADRTSLGAVDPWRDTPTIFPFLLRHHGSSHRKPLTLAEARNVYRWLLQDVGPSLPATATARERRIAARRCHIGQPVRILSHGRGELGALRLCLNASVISTSASAPSTARAAAVAGIEHVCEKAALIVRYYDRLAAAVR